MPNEWTHKAMVRRLANWLKYTKKQTVVITELHTRNSETPDVIAWNAAGVSTLIEVKVTRSDFLMDGKKWFRRRMEEGMGDTRYIAAPAGMLKAEEIPVGWGLLEVDEPDTSFPRIRETAKPDWMESEKQRECVVLISALRRLEISTAVYVVAETNMEASE